MEFLFVFFPLVGFLLVYLLTHGVRYCAQRFGIVDVPSGPRKHHDHAMPLLGGVGIYIGFFLVLFFFVVAFHDVARSLMASESVMPKHLVGFFLGATVLLVGGILDDVYHLRPWQQIAFPVVAAALIIASGIGIKSVSNPFFPLGLADDAVLSLENIEIQVLTYHGIPYFLTLWSDVFTFFWLLGMMYTTKLLDGLDGLVSGITVLGSVVMFVASFVTGNTLSTLFALILASVYAGFLPHNFFPARIFLGESGSILAGFFLGALAIMGDAKVSVTFLVLGLPILDVAWVMWNRVVRNKKSPFEADRTHLHFRLLSRGLSHRKSVLFLYGVSAALGALGLILQNVTPLLGFGIVCAVALWLVTWVVQQ